VITPPSHLTHTSLTPPSHLTHTVLTPPSCGDGSSPCTGSGRAVLPQELELYKKLKHQHIVGYIDARLTPAAARCTSSWSMCLEAASPAC
jgi:hypothetical protein